MWSTGGASMLSMSVGALGEKSPEFPFLPQPRVPNNKLERLIGLSRWFSCGKSLEWKELFFFSSRVFVGRESSRGSLWTEWDLRHMKTRLQMCRVIGRNNDCKGSAQKCRFPGWRLVDSENCGRNNYMCRLLREKPWSQSFSYILWMMPLRSPDVSADLFSGSCRKQSSQL